MMQTTINKFERRQESLSPEEKREKKRHCNGRCLLFNDMTNTYSTGCGVCELESCPNCKRMKPSWVIKHYEGKCADCLMEETSPKMTKFKRRSEKASTDKSSPDKSDSSIEAKAKNKTREPSLSNGTPKKAKLNKPMSSPEAIEDTESPSDKDDPFSNRNRLLLEMSSASYRNRSRPEKSSSEASPIKRGRGRPKKIQTKESGCRQPYEDDNKPKEETKSESKSESNTRLEDQVESKCEDDNMSLQSYNPSDEQSQETEKQAPVIKRGRGRPKKIRTPEEIEDLNAKRARIRERKIEIVKEKIEKEEKKAKREASQGRNHQAEETLPMEQRQYQITEDDHIKKAGDRFSKGQELEARNTGGKRLCIRCGGRLVAIGGQRMNGVGINDWNTRIYHKKCFKAMMSEDNEEMACLLGIKH